MHHVQAARAKLTELYESGADKDQKRERKQAILAELKKAAGRDVDQTGRNSPGWLRSPLNNATLIPLSLYQGRLAEFRDLLVRCEGDLSCFYERAEVLAEK